MFQTNTLARVQAALGVGQQVAMGAQQNGAKLEKEAEARLVIEVARLTLEEDERQRHSIVIPSRH